MTQTKRPPRPPLNDGLCVFCKQADHRCWDCTVHSSRASREAVLRHEHRCFNCLEPGHMTPTCTRGNCRHCNGKHHSSICGRATTGSTNRRLSGNQGQTNRQNSRNAGPIASGGNQEPLRSSSLCTSVAVPVNEDPKLLKLGRILTATVMAFNEDRKLFEEIGVVLDTASDTSYIAESAVKKLGLKKLGEQYTAVKGVGDVETSSFARKNAGLFDVRMADSNGNRLSILHQ
ncbi:hypothetical protein L596_029523 [Steinernema carpocapsae]|uniref:CCHC-type domain-containing protein n=1 Tax=Steinernema carpocapsae TaxID=34508 RepID=A0A4U5LUV8_STECR|nr:hypothetical protein L596_029523 [Steinernema carpocapsae]